MFSITWKTEGTLKGGTPPKGGARSDYTVRLKSGRIAVIDLKGCLDGANTTLSSKGRMKPTSSSSGACALTSPRILGATSGRGSTRD